MTKAAQILVALGGTGNVSEVEPCITLSLIHISEPTRPY